MADHEPPQGGAPDLAYLVNEGTVIQLHKDAFIAWIPGDVAETAAFAPSFTQVQAWIDDPQCGVSVADVAELLEGEQ
jgi:hypothetical protein